MHFGTSGNPPNILHAPSNILHTLSKILLTPSLTHSGGPAALSGQDVQGHESFQPRTSGTARDWFPKALLAKKIEWERLQSMAL